MNSSGLTLRYQESAMNICNLDKMGAGNIFLNHPLKCCFAKNGCDQVFSGQNEQYQHEKKCSFQKIICLIITCGKYVTMKDLPQHLNSHQNM